MISACIEVAQLACNAKAIFLKFIRDECEATLENLEEKEELFIYECGKKNLYKSLKYLGILSPHATLFYSLTGIATEVATNKRVKYAVKVQI